MPTPVTNLQIFAALTPGAFPAPLTVNRADGCVPTHTAQGVFDFDTPLGLLSTEPNLLVTATAGTNAAYITTVEVVSQTKVRVRVWDAGGLAADPTKLTVSVSVVPRVS